MVLLSLALALSAGCNREPVKTVVAKGVAPTPVTKVAAATLPTRDKVKTQCRPNKCPA